VEILPTVKAWVRYAKFEMQHNDVTRARTCYERALEALGDDGHTVRGTAQHSTAQHSTAQPVRSPDSSPGVPHCHSWKWLLLLLAAGQVLVSVGCDL